MRLCIIAFAIATGLILGCAAPARSPIAAAHGADSAPAPAVAWLPWSDAIFETARARERLVILDLEAVWCHWCHVMEAQTYADPRVRRLLADRFLATRVDQDARPDLAARYRDYGWPATIVFNARGQELAKLSGFVSADELLDVLNAALRAPDKVQAPPARPPQYAANAALPERLRSELQRRQYATHDAQRGGLRTAHKFLDPDSVEYGLRRAAGGSARDAEMAERTLAANLKLHDPIWGGVYQYSTQGDWDHPHFEKIVSTQAANLRIYALAFAQTRDPRWRAAAQSVHAYLRAFLTSPEGAFYASQDADVVRGRHSADYFALGDEERRKRGVPRVDMHVYARENGMLIRSLALLYAATGDDTPLADAVRAADWINANRAAAGGGFRHDERDTGGPYLGDTVQMGDALLELYVVTGESRRLTQSLAALRFVRERFADPRGATPGFASAVASAESTLAAVRLVDEQIAVARWANRLYRYSGDSMAREVAESALRYLASGEVALENAVESGVLLAAEELATDPLHVVVVGRRDDATARLLHRAALLLPDGYKQIEWRDPAGDPPRDAAGEPRPANGEIEFPDLGRPAAFLCAGGRCSSPIFSAEELATRAAQFRR